MSRSSTILATQRKSPAAEGKDIRLAAIDVGSNSLHMIVAQVDSDGAATTLWREKEMVGLGRNSFPSHVLSNEAMDRAILTLQRFCKIATRRGCEKVVAVATSAVREAENGGDFIERVRREAGLNIRLVSAREEAKLIYLGVRHAMDFPEGAHLLIDIGGGSVEFIVADAKQALLLESRKLGSARMTARFIRHDPPREKEIAALQQHFEAELGSLLENIRHHKPVRIIGTSGTMENLALMCGGQDGGNKDDDEGGEAFIQRDHLDKLVERLRESRAKQRVKIRGLDEKRQDQIIAGALLVQMLMQRLEIKRIMLCRSALREGILLEYIGRHLPDLAIRREVPDPRRRSVLDLARRCDWHEHHSMQVARITLRLFDELQKLHGLDGRARELIEYGAMVHDIGWHISSKSHHKHSMYMVQHGNLKGFTPAEVSIIANLARYHRKALPQADHEHYADLERRQQKIVEVGGALLRLADGLDRSHCKVVKDLSCKIGKRRVKVLLEGRGDLQLELWAARRKTNMFLQVFKRAITFKQK